MCGRFVQAMDEPQWRAMCDDLGVAAGERPPPRYNLAPTQPMWGVWPAAGRGPLAGAVPFGIAAGERGLVINARAETVHERPLFQGLLGAGRALVAASAFYEWAPAAEAGGRKRPHGFALSHGRPFWFAALVRRRGEDAGGVLLTCAANAAVAPFHARMPVMLGAAAAGRWLSPTTPATEALALLRPCPERMRVWPVARTVNSPRNDSAACLAPISDEPGR